MAKTVCKTNIKKALRKSWDTQNYEDVTDEWAVRWGGAFFGGRGAGMFCDCSVRMWNYETGEEMKTNIGGCTSMTDHIEFATECLLRMYNERMAA